MPTGRIARAAMRALSTRAPKGGAGRDGSNRQSPPRTCGGEIRLPRLCRRILSRRSELLGRLQSRTGHGRIEYGSPRLRRPSIQPANRLECESGHRLVRSRRPLEMRDMAGALIGLHARCQVLMTGAARRCAHSAGRTCRCDEAGGLSRVALRTPLVARTSRTRIDSIRTLLHRNVRRLTRAGFCAL
jgi:hypothetical protein